MNFSFLNRLQVLTSPAATQQGDVQRAKAMATVVGLRADLPELLAVAVINIESGRALASHSSLRELAPAKAAPFHAEVVRQKRRAIEALCLHDEKIEDILVTLYDQVHLSRVSEDGQHLLYLIVSNRDTNLAIARAVLRARSI